MKASHSLSRLFLLRVALVVATALLLLWTPLQNGYPLVHPDVGTYISSSVSLLVPADRPVGYGLIIRALRFVPSLWAVVVLQALGTAYLLLRVAEVLLNKTAARVHNSDSLFPTQTIWVALGIVVLTILTTTLSTVVGFILADIFASWLLLGTFLFILAPHATDRVLASLAMTAGVWTHNSHVPLAFGLALLVASLLLLSPRGRRAWLRPALQWFGVLALAVTSMFAVNFGLGAGAALTRGGETILLNRLAETSVLQRVLERDCPWRRWRLCSDLPLIRAHAGQPRWYLFGEESPIARVGWNQGAEEQRAVIARAFECCWQTILAGSIRDSWKQFWDLPIQGYLAPLGEEMSAVGAIRRNYPGEWNAFAASRQQTAARTPTLLVPWNEVAMQIACLLIALGVVVSGAWRRHRSALLLIGGTLAFLVENAFIAASVSGEVSRYQARVYWLLPFVVLVALAGEVMSRRAAARAAGMLDNRVTLHS